MVSEGHFNEIVGQSKAIRIFEEQVITVSSSQATVLILGETGMSKELVPAATARARSRLLAGQATFESWKTSSSAR